MKNATVILLALAPGLLLAGCGKPAETSGQNEMPAAGMSGTNTAPVSGSGAGTITSLDAAAGKITLDHGAIPEAGWPAMEMTFDAKSAILGTAKVGDKVQFDMTTASGAPTVTAIRPQ